MLQCNRIGQEQPYKREYAVISVYSITFITTGCICTCQVKVRNPGLHESFSALMKTTPASAGSGSGLLGLGAQAGQMRCGHRREAWSAGTGVGTDHWRRADKFKVEDKALLLHHTQVVALHLGCWSYKPKRSSLSLSLSFFKLVTWANWVSKE